MKELNDILQEKEIWIDAARNSVKDGNWLELTGIFITTNGLIEVGRCEQRSSLS
jgi:hypothetical protein